MLYLPVGVGQAAGERERVVTALGGAPCANID